MVAHFKEMGVQGSGIDAAVAQDIGVAGQQDAGAPVVQLQDQTEIVHPGVQSRQLPQERRGVLLREQAAAEVLQLPGLLCRGSQNAVAEVPAQLAGRSGGQGLHRPSPLLHQTAEGLVVVQGPQEFALGVVLSQGDIETVHHRPVEVHGQRLPQRGGRQVRGSGQHAADMVLMDMGADHPINVAHAPGFQIVRQGNAAGGAVLKFGGLRAAAVDQHDKGAVREAGVGAFQQDGLAVAHVHKGQFHLVHRRYLMARLM